MIPLRDTIPSRNFPIVNWCLIGINVFVFLFQLSLGENKGLFIYLYGLVPARYTIPELGSYFTVFHQVFSFVSFMFLHGGFWHLLSNMWFLYIFGDNIEDRLGPFRYLAFYLLCGIASGLSHLMLNTQSNLPTIGASGAVAGVMGAYMILHPKSKILVLIPIIIFPWFVEVPAYLFLGIWAIMQFINATVTQSDMGGVAWWAHFGGFIFGILFLKMFMAMPKIGFTGLSRKITSRKKSHRLQIIRPVGPENESNLYGTIQITSHEAISGTIKSIGISWQMNKKVYRVSVPANVSQGTVLKLTGLGRRLSGGNRGNLFLKINIRG
ncbi:MAG: rhomboid family intramembrane serine protease [Desulfobacterales bacterium]|nr:rhomboid family intramembrane serine protease [Desulfobacterales bacterium]